MIRRSPKEMVEKVTKPVKAKKVKKVKTGIAKAKKYSHSKNSSITACGLTNDHIQAILDMIAEGYRLGSNFSSIVEYIETRMEALPDDQKRAISRAFILMASRDVVDKAKSHASGN